MIDYNKYLNPEALNIKPSGIRKFFDITETMTNVISLGVGEPDFITPWEIRDAGIQTLKKGYTQYYRKHFVTVPGNSWFVSCNSAHMCPKLWLYQNCIQKVCLIHPLKKQVIIDSSTDVKQLETLLEKYKDW